MVEVRELKNGIKVIMESGSHYSSAGFGVWIKVGSRNETKENNGIAHFIEHMLFKGTNNRSANDINKEIGFLGGNVNAYTSKENTSFYARTLPEYLPRAMELIGDMICNSTLPNEEFEREKGVVCQEIDMYKDSPEDYVHEILQKKIWKKHPMGYYISGSKRNVNGFKRNDVLQFMKQYYVGENMVISVAGNINKQKVLEDIERIFGGISKNGANIPLTIPSYHKVNICRKKDIEQVHMNIGFRGASLKNQDRYGFTVLNTIFGGDVNSRLFQEIREKNGLTYAVYSYGSSFGDTGLFQIYAAMNREQAGKTYGLVEKLLKELVQNGVTEAEIESARHQITVEMTLNRDNLMTKMNGNAKSFINYGEIIPFKKTIESINKITREDVEKIIDKYIVLDQMSVGVVGPIEKCWNV